MAQRVRYIFKKKKRSFKMTIRMSHLNLDYTQLQFSACAFCLLIKCDTHVFIRFSLVFDLFSILLLPSYASNYNLNIFWSIPAKRCRILYIHKYIRKTNQLNGINEWMIFFWFIVHLFFRSAFYRFVVILAFTFSCFLFSFFFHFLTQQSFSFVFVFVFQSET